jgi:ubiquitin-like-conjugating enzyme ATG3
MGSKLFKATQSANHDIGDIPDLDQNVNSLSLSAHSTSARNPDATNQPDEAIPNLDDIPDMDDDLGDAGGVVEAEDDATAAAQPAATHQAELGQNNPSNLISVRTYDCLITYDKSVSFLSILSIMIDRARPSDHDDDAIPGTIKHPECG